MTAEELAQIQALVGPVTREQLRYVDCFVGGGIGLFLPTVGPCLYAITPDHRHPAYSFVLCFDSYARVYAGDREIATRPGTVLAMDPELVHHEERTEERPHYIAILIGTARLEAEAGGYPLSAPLRFGCRSFAPGRELTGLLKEFMSECEARLPGREALLTAIGTRIVHSILRAAFDLAPPTEGIGNRVEIHRAVQHIQTHAGDKLSVELLAGVAAMSPSHFSRVFRQETGQTPQAYLNRVRLEQARKLLRAGGRSIAVIALECGFATPSHFSEAHRRGFGQTPSEFVRSLDS